MDYSKIVFTLEFDDDSANERANEFLTKGWLLISVGPKLVDIINETDQAYYNTSYVVGATKEQYDAYQKELNSEEDWY
ncbi:hypothetical protein P7H62_06235 [Vagococcus carniphilus]|uniref:hypothetical protein n=1 Tax=Vagococcus carniphilus TaxID=218144 RepID=UPI00289093A9|nr:hypothetical protein [Vagococcus carniphilus]MDT2830879.1 hypothetical protein [Vagococcus carniphilus]MDT2854042.1 hypothetical protein [Vagococcus carniphilus]